MQGARAPAGLATRERTESWFRVATTLGVGAELEGAGAGAAEL
jgi:hypothetical protein